jgi:hypothetical protein
MLNPNTIKFISIQLNVLDLIVPKLKKLIHFYDTIINFPFSQKVGTFSTSYAIKTVSFF